MPTHRPSYWCHSYTMQISWAAGASTLSPVTMQCTRTRRNSADLVDPTWAMWGEHRWPPLSYETAMEEYHLEKFLIKGKNDFLSNERKGWWHILSHMSTVTACTCMLFYFGPNHKHRSAYSRTEPDSRKTPPLDHSSWGLYTAFELIFVFSMSTLPYNYVKNEVNWIIDNHRSGYLGMAKGFQCHKANQWSIFKDSTSTSDSYCLKQTTPPSSMIFTLSTSPIPGCQVIPVPYSEGLLYIDTLSCRTTPPLSPARKLRKTWSSIKWNAIAGSSS